MNKKIINIGIIALFLVTSAQPVTTTFAQEYKLLEPLPCLEGMDNAECNDTGYMPSISVEKYFNYAFNLFIALAAVTAVLMIVWGGLEYMTTDSYTGKEFGRKRAENAVWGLLMVLASYLILKTIDPRFVDLPTTIVPKIVITTNVSSTDYLGLISKQIESYAAMSAEQKQDLISRIESQQNLEKEIQDLKDKINNIEQGNVNSSVEELQKMKVELSQKETKLNDQNIKLKVDGSIIQFKNDLYKVYTDAKDQNNQNKISPEQVQAQIAGMVSKRDAYVKNINTIPGDHKATIETIDDQLHAATVSMLTLKYASVPILREKQITEIKQQITEAVKLIRDPVTKEKADSIANAYIMRLKEYEAAKDIINDTLYNMP